MTGLIDIGANLLHDQFDADRDAVLRRALAAGVSRLIVTATSLETGALIQRFLDAHGPRADWPMLYTTIGVHPHEAAGTGAGWERQLQDLAGHPAVVAIGETGLDYHRNFSPPARQREVFAAQIRIANALGWPLFVHDRDTCGEVLAMLRDHDTPPDNVVIHCFTGSANELDDYLAAGYWIGITGWVCDQKRGKVLRQLVPRIPLSRLLIESDAPYLLPHTLPPDLKSTVTGRRNEPSYLPHVADTLAGLMQVDVTSLAAATRANTVRLFRLPGAALDGPPPS